MITCVQPRAKCRAETLGRAPECRSMVTQGLGGKGLDLVRENFLEEVTTS